MSYENPVLIQTVQERERKNSNATRPSLPVEQERKPLLSNLAEDDDEIEVTSVLSPSHSAHSLCGPSLTSAVIDPAHVQIPVE